MQILLFSDFKAELNVWMPKINFSRARLWFPALPALGAGQPAATPESAHVQNRGLRPRGSGLFRPEHLGSFERLGFEGLTTRASAFKDKVDIPSETSGPAASAAWCQAWLVPFL